MIPLSRANTEEFQCAGKQALRSKGQADKVVKRMAARGRINPYHCAACGMWHIGTTTGKVKR